MLIDSHCHLNFKAYAGDLSEVIGRVHKAGMKLINVGAAFDSSQKAVELTKEPDFYASCGLHPIHVFDEEFDLKKYQDLIDNNKKVVAIGETGYDFWHMPKKQCFDKQTQVFEAHIVLAQKNNLPLIIHGRSSKTGDNAYQEIYNTLKKNKAKSGVVHCFGGNLAEAKLFADLGFYIGFTGVVTFDKTGVLEEIIKWIPADKMLIETDAPYLTPVPHRGQRNEPVYVEFVAAKIAQIKNMTKEEVIEITGENAIKLFSLK